ncbi:hypothetical protein HID58_094843 [Brassica napus]|uniref:Ubiquitin-like protease family profile domain-containing protein n=1 Tax=Brassica napus TaxID=3708 RepID=A0ABQ7X8F2_BRANA|nr:hypothetical protein HID58_094843 [Brassica napus]
MADKRSEMVRVRTGKQTEVEGIVNAEVRSGSGDSGEEMPVTAAVIKEQRRGLKGTKKVYIHIVSAADKENIRNVIINQAAPIVWEDKIVDKKVNALLEAIHKEGGLGLVTWVDHGTNIIQTAKDIEKNDGEKAEDENEKSDGKETSLKRKTEVMIASTKKIKALDSSVSVSSTEPTEVICMKMELEQQAKKVETLECKLEEMGKQLKSYETMRIRIDLLEQEVMLLTEKSKTNKMFKVPHLKYEDISTDELFANVKAERGEMAESDDESTVDGSYPTLNIRRIQPQKSSAVKIIQSTVSVAEKFTQKKIGQTLKVMGVEQTKVAREKSTRSKKPGPALQTPFRCILPNVAHFLFHAWIIQNNGVEFFKVLRTPQDWLNQEARDLPIFPNGAHDYCSGKLPAFAETWKKWMVDVDYIYSVLFVNNNHWVALFITIPNRCIEVLDCGLKGSSNEQVVKAVKPIVHILPHLLRASAPPSERPKMSVEQYKVRRPRQGILQMLKTGDSGIYAINALGAEFTTSLSDENIKMVRENLAAEIFEEIEQHGRIVSNPLPLRASDRELLYPY